MTEFVTCASCGARNGSESVWCTMCFEPLRQPEPDQSAVEPGRVEVPSIEPTSDGALAAMETQAAAIASDPPASEAIAGSIPSDSTWSCGTCESVNPIAENVCPVCGTTIFQTMGAEEHDVTLTQDQGLRLGLVPGLAHARLGEPVLGFILAVLVLACLAFGLIFISSGGAIWGLVVGFVGLLTWGVSIFDVNQRIAGAAPILRPRVMTIIGGLVIIVIMVAGFVAGATAVRTPGS